MTIGKSKMRVYLSFLQWLIILVSSSRGDQNDVVSVEHPECRLYLAESTIPGAGLGIFTGIDLQPGENIAEPDIIIPLHDEHWHAGEDLDYWFLWNEYSWASTEVGMEYDAATCSALVIGTGCMPNCNFALINAKEGKPQYGHAGLHRSKDVGISGFTGFHNQRMFTLRNVPAGGELFVSYGEAWFADREEDMGPIPFEGNYEEVDGFLQNLEKKFGVEDSEFTRDLWDVVMTMTNFKTQNSMALPLSFEDMKASLSVGSAESRLPYSIRTTDWLKEHGRCMDNIRPGNSTIRQAGRGAFASRFIPEGGLIAPGPLLHIANRTSLNIYEEGEDFQRDTSQHVSMQLILNYCFGHRESTVILCPYTSPSAYINHSSKSPNAKVVWAKDDTPNHNPGWLEDSVEYLKKQERIGLSIDFIATRDIQSGEEVFIDYGPEWERAWEEYVENWSPPLNSDKFMPAPMIEEPLRTAEEALTNPYPENIVLYCYYGYVPGTPEGIHDWNDIWKGTLLPYPCEVLSREARDKDSDGNPMYYYKMRMLDETKIDPAKIGVMTFDDEGVFEGIPFGEEHILTNVPGSSILVKDMMYTKDEFQTDAFRHEMMMPDDIFPEEWRNVRK